MYKSVIISMMLFLPASLGLAQPVDVDEKGGVNLCGVHSAGPKGSKRDQGDTNWQTDVTDATGDPRCLGVEYDGTYYWITGANDYYNGAYLYRMKQDGSDVSVYDQPQDHSPGWGWRDLAIDGSYFYAGDPREDHEGMVNKFYLSGSSVVVHQSYGPFPVNLCRAIAYDPDEDCFWVGDWDSPIYKCFKNGTYEEFENLELEGIYGMAIEEAHVDNDTKKLWIWSQDGDGVLATEFNIEDGNEGFTGNSFEGDSSVGGNAGGACAYDMGSGWEMVGMHQGDPDTIVAYDLTDDPLEDDVRTCSAYNGTPINFSLKAGQENAGRIYALLAGMSGSIPGTPLPGGQILPLNWDAMTDMLLSVNPPGFIDALDGNGHATIATGIPPFTLPIDLTLTFAYTLPNPFDFVSNPVELLVQGGVPSYAFDDGTSENSVGWSAGGEMCWLHVFDSDEVGIPLVQGVSTAFGCSAYPGMSPGNGTPCTVYVWDDPDDDGIPDDAVLLASQSAIVVNVDKDVLIPVPLSPPVIVSGKFFVGCSLDHSAGQFVVPMDRTPSPFHELNKAWIAGNPGGTFNPSDMSGNELHEMSKIGLPSCFLLRAF
ncbi:MAG: hypothetical protein ACYTG7_14025 [Planctomycetota bacterium]|jgi:hypothetical protein